MDLAPYLYEVLVVGHDEDGLAGPGRFEDSVVLVVATVGDNHVGFDDTAARCLAHLHENFEVFLGSRRIPLVAVVGLTCREHPIDVLEDVRAQSQAELDRVVDDPDAVRRRVSRHRWRRGPSLEGVDVSPDDRVDQDVHVEHDGMGRRFTEGQVLALRARTRLTRSPVSSGAMPSSWLRCAPYAWMDRSRCARSATSIRRIARRRKALRFPPAKTSTRWSSRGRSASAMEKPTVTVRSRSAMGLLPTSTE
jgi:hypothetical protein